MAKKKHSPRIDDVVSISTIDAHPTPPQDHSVPTPPPAAQPPHLIHQQPTPPHVLSVSLVPFSLSPVHPARSPLTSRSIDSPAPPASALRPANHLPPLAGVRPPLPLLRSLSESSLSISWNQRGGRHEEGTTAAGCERRAGGRRACGASWARPMRETAVGRGTTAVGASGWRGQSG